MSAENPFKSGNQNQAAESAPTLRSIAARVEALRAKTNPPQESASAENPAPTMEDLVAEVIDMAEGNANLDKHLSDDPNIRPGEGLDAAQRRAHSKAMNQFEILRDSKEELEKLAQEVEQLGPTTSPQEAAAIKQDIEEQLRDVKVKLNANLGDTMETRSAAQKARQNREQFEYDQGEIAQDPIAFAVEQVLAAHQVAGQDVSAQRERLMYFAKQKFEDREYERKWNAERGL